MCALCCTSQLVSRPHLFKPAGPGSSVVTSTSHSTKCDATPCHTAKTSCSSPLLNPGWPSESYSGVTMLSSSRYLFQPSVPCQQPCASYMHRYLRQLDWCGLYPSLYVKQVGSTQMAVVIHGRQMVASCALLLRFRRHSCCCSC